ncbi:hypothetical protein [Bradyrhizobium ottawaense]|uniref:hypothetical protein n=1 Tax=Bradyrhizobium ottawaense TaxID=931866 RepID=UPI001BAA6CD8|nr:hypothetical protein [Bradyrhizobium ottawaense]MBR1290140.1 hypothetical protein [Bradyrhizobium ottawaense]
MPAPPDIELRSINPNPVKSTKFGPDRRRPPGKGRKLGQPNLFTRDLRAAIMEAAHNVGDGDKRKGLVAYLEDAARYHPKAFCQLLAKSLPFSVTSEGLGAGVVVAVNIVSVPQGHNSDGSVMESARSSFPVIEHQPQREPVLDARSRRLAELRAMPLERLAELAAVDAADVVED